MNHRIAGLLSIAMLLASVRMAQAQTPVPPPLPTTISVPEMDCPSCAKRMTKELLKVPGVGQVFADVETKTMTVRPQSGATPSPLQIWEAVERAGYAPSRLSGPSGTFTAKPKS